MNDDLNPDLQKLFNTAPPEEDAVFTRQTMQKIRVHERQFQLLRRGITILALCTLMLVTLVFANWLTTGIQVVSKSFAMLAGSWSGLLVMALVLVVIGCINRFRTR